MLMQVSAALLARASEPIRMLEVQAVFVTVPSVFEGCMAVFLLRSTSQKCPLILCLL